MPRAEKVAEVQHLADRLGRAKGSVLVSFQGLTVAQATRLRSQVRAQGLEFRVVKNTLLRRAAEAAGVEGLEPFLTGTTGVLFGFADAVEPARLVADFRREVREIQAKAGIIDGRVLGEEDIRRVASLPSREVLLAQLAGTLQAPLTRLAQDLEAPVSRLARALGQLAAKAA